MYSPIECSNFSGLKTITMIKIYVGVGLLIAFIGWLLLRLIIKRDLKQHIDDLYAWIFLIVVWFLIYWFLLR
jgi:hypothetical protein